jgi:hypothetical protein
MIDAAAYAVARAQLRAEDFHAKGDLAAQAGDVKLALHYWDRADVWEAEVARLSA